MSEDIDSAFLEEIRIADFVLRYAEWRGWLENVDRRAWSGRLTKAQEEEAYGFIKEHFIGYNIFREMERYVSDTQLRPNGEFEDMVNTLLASELGHKKVTGKKGVQVKLKKQVDQLPGGTHFFPFERGKLSGDVVRFLCVAHYATAIDGKKAVSAIADSYKFYTKEEEGKIPNQYIVNRCYTSEQLEEASPSVLYDMNWKNLKEFKSELGVSEIEGRLEKCPEPKK